MSIKTMTAIWDQSKQKGGKLLLLLALADYADDQGYCWPSEKTLAKKIRMSARHVRRMADDMQQAGELYVKSGQESGQSNRYVVMAGLPRESFENVLRVKLKTPTAEIREIVARYYGTDDSDPSPDDSGEGGQNVLPPESGEGGQNVRGGRTPESGGVGLQSPTNRHVTVNDPPTVESADLPPAPRLPAAGNGAKAPGGAAAEEKTKTKQAEVADQPAAPTGDGIKQVKSLFSELTGIKPGKQDHGRWSKDAKNLLEEYGAETAALMKKAWQQLAGPKVAKGQIVIAAPGSLRVFMQQAAAQQQASAAADPTINTGAGYRPPGLSDEQIEQLRRAQAARRAGAAAAGGAM